MSSHELNLGVVFWEEARKADATSSRHIQSCQQDSSPGSPAQVNGCQFSPLTALFPLLPYWSLQRSPSTCSLHLKGQEFCVTSWRAQHLRKSRGILYGELSVCLCQCGLMMFVLYLESQPNTPLGLVRGCALASRASPSVDGSGCGCVVHSKVFRIRPGFDFYPGPPRTSLLLPTASTSAGALWGAGPSGVFSSLPTARVMRE